MRWSRAAPVLGAAAVLAAAPAAAQSPGSGAAPFAGRWAVTIEGGAPPRVLGELRLSDSAGTLVGTLLLQTQDSAPAPLREVDAARGRIEFQALTTPGMRLVGQLRGDRIAGQAMGGAGEQLQTWTAERIADEIEFYPSLPRFTLRQVILGRTDSAVVLPGAWLGAAAAAGWAADSLAVHYARAARAAGLEPLAPAVLASDASAYLLGVYRRDATAPVLRAALEGIARDLPAAGHRARFNQLFRGRDGILLIDMHAVALDRARYRRKTLEWSDAAPALEAAGWLRPAGEGDGGAVPYALYRLAHLRSADSLEFGLVEERFAPVESARAVMALLDGYAEAEAWYPEAVRFLLEAPWVRAEGAAAPSSIAGRMAELWDPAPPVPAIRSAYFGYNQAVPRYGTPDALADQLLHPENWPAREWLARNGRAQLLTVVQRLGADSVVPTLLQGERRMFRLASVRRLATESLNGFLEPVDAIVADPGVPPLLALGTIVHEWQHLAFERARWRQPAAEQPRTVDARTGAVTLLPPDPIIAEGVAEWGAERVLAPAVAAYPIVGLAEPLKRARMAVAGSDDGHVSGYLLAGALGEVLAPREATALLVSAARDPRRVTRDPAVARAWRRHARTPDRVLAREPALVLVPETEFTIEGNWPDPLEVRIRF